MKNILFIAFLLPLLCNAQLITFTYDGDTLKAVNPRTGSKTAIITSSPTTFSIGTVNATAPLTIANFSTSFPSPQSGTLVQAISSGISTNARISLDSYNGANILGSIYQGRRSGGSATSPSAAIADYTLSALGGDGYGTTGFHNISVGAFVIKSEGTMTDVSAPTYLSLMTTPVGSIVPVERFRVKSTGIVNVANLTEGILQSGSSGDISNVSTGSAGQFLRRNLAGNGYEFATLSGGGNALTSSPLSQFAATTSAQLAGVLSDETGTGLSVFSTDAALTTPTLTYTASPSTPSSNNIKLFDYKVGGRDMAGYVDPFGLDNALQPLFGRNGMKIWQSAGNSTTITAIGGAALTATGTATALNVATTNRYTQIRGVEYLVTVAATTAVAGWRDGVAQFFLGNSAGNGGFHFVCRFGAATGVSTTTNRCFVGMSSSVAAPTDVEPSSLLNQVGIGWDAADANIQFMNNDGTGTCTKTSLGIAVPTVDRTSVYELSMFAAPNSTTIYYTFKDLAEGGATVSGSVNTDIPAVNTLLAARGWMSVGGTSSVIGIGLKSLYLESDY